MNPLDAGVSKDDLMSILLKDLTEKRQQLQQLAWRAESLEAIAQAISSTLELKTLLHILVKKVVEVLEVERATICLPDERLETIADYVTFGVPEERLHLLTSLKGRRIADFALGRRLLEAKEPLVIANAAKSDLIPREFIEALGVCATMVVPVRSKERPVAALFLDTSRERTFTPDEIALAQAIANQAAVAIENARLYERLASSEAQYRGIFENALIGIYQSTPEGKLLAANLTLARMLGYESVEELLKVPAADLRANPEDRLQWQRALEQAGVVQSEGQLRRRDGSLLWVRDMSRVVRDATGRVLYYEGMVMDITERKQAEAEIHLQKLRLQQLFENAPMGIVMLDENDRILDANKAFETIFQFSVDEIRGRLINEVIVPEPLAEEASALSFRTLQGEIVGKETVRRRKDGRPVQVYIYGVPIVVNGRSVGTYGVYADITHRKQAEERIAYQALLLSEVNDAIIATDLNSRITAWNRAAERVFGWTAEEVIGRDIRQVIPMRLHGITREEIRREALEKGFWKGEVIRYARDGRELVIDWSISTIKDAAGRTIGIVGINRDITERKRAELERQVLFEIIQGVTTTANLDELLRLIHQSLKKVLYAENCFVALYDPKTGMFSFPYFVDQFDTAPRPQDVGKSCTAYVFRTGRPMLIPEDLFRQLVEKGEVELVGTPAPSWLGVPLKTPLETIGVLVVQHYEDEHAYTERDLEFLASVGGEIAIAIERKRAEESLREALSRFEAVIEHTPLVAIQGFDREGTILHWNTACKDLYGFDVTEAFGKRLQDLLLEGEEAQEFEQTLKEIWDTGQAAAPREWQVRTRSGEQRWVYSTMFPIFERGAVVEVFCMDVDITERKRAEEALRRSQQQYQGLVESISDIVFSLDPEGRLTYVNRAVQQIGGYAPEELIGKPYAAFVHPEDVEIVQQILARRLRGDAQPGYFRTVAKNGEVRFMQSLGQYVMEGGQIVGFTGILRDITEQHRAEARLARIYDVATRYQGQELFDQAAVTLAELLSTPYVFIGELEPPSVSFNNGEPLVSERALPTLTRRQDRLSVHVRAFYNKGVVERGVRSELFCTVCERVIEERRLHVLPHRARQLFPEDALLAARNIESYIGAPIMSGAGEVVGIVSAMDERPREFTESEARILQIIGQRIGAEIERGRREEAQRKLQEQLFQAQKMESVGKLAGGVAHDFNNLLTGIMGFTELTLLELGREHPLAEYLNQALSLSGRARDLVRQLLLFSRPERGEKHICDLHEFLNDAAVLLRRTIPENIQIELALTTEEVVLEMNSSQLQQVLLNLALNAQDAMPEGGRLLIQTKAVLADEATALPYPEVQPGRFVRLSVSDTGVGIPPEVLPHIFEPFFSTKDVGKGTGLGLSVVYGIVKAHGGWIEVESEVGRGTSFHIYLPLVERSVRPTAVEAEEKALGGRETILIVEDEPMVLNLGRKMLEKVGYRAIVARSGQEALQLYTAHRDEIDLILLDVVMPQMNGPQVFEELRRLNPQAKILLVTGYSVEEVVEPLLQQGAEGIVQKPYDLKTLGQAVRRVLDGEKLPGSAA